MQIAVEAREALQAEGIGTRVVSMPCLDWFEAQDAAYIESVLPAAVTARVSIEAGIAQPWWRWLGAARPPGVAGALRRLRRRRDPVPEFGFTAEAAVAAAKESLAAAGRAGSGPSTAVEPATSSAHVGADRLPHPRVTH